MKSNPVSTRPKSSFSFRNSQKNKKSLYPIISQRGFDSKYDFKVNLNPKLEAEKIYKENMELKETIKELITKIDFFKTNNQKLIQDISKKNKEIDELTNQVILKNKELQNEQRKKRENKNNNNKASVESNIINNDNSFESQLIIKKLKNEVNDLKEEMQRLKLELLQKDEKLFEIKKEKKYTDYQESSTKYNILKEEFNKLRTTKTTRQDKDTISIIQSEQYLIKEIQNLNEVIKGLKKENDYFYLEKKKLNDEIKDLKSRLELSNNKNKLIKKKKDLYERRYKKNVKEQVILKEYEEEKKEMKTKIDELQNKVDKYMSKEISNKEYKKNKIINNFEENKKNDIKVYQNIQRNIINVKKNNVPEENYDNKLLLMQSLITELTKENKELLEKNKNYEIKINSLLQTNKEILNSNMGMDDLFKSNNNMPLDNNLNLDMILNEPKKKNSEDENISKDDDDDENVIL
jgi:hypothetical protein